MYAKKRRYAAMSGAPGARKPTRKKPARVQGLVPFYRGWQPRQFARGEWKYVDTSLSLQCNTTASLTLLNGLAPGTAANQRVGMKVTVRSLQINARLRTQPTTGVDQFARVTLILDRQPNGAAPGAITDILAADSVNGLRNLANRKRFKIMWDRTIPLGGILNGAGTGSQTPNLRTIKLYMKFRRPIVTEFNTGVAGTIADISTNSIYLLTTGTEAAGATDNDLLGYVRCRFTDM